MINTNLYLYEDLWRERSQEMRQQIAINRIVFPRQHNPMLHWLAQSLLRTGTALQRYCEKRLADVPNQSLGDMSTLEKLHLSC